MQAERERTGAVWLASYPKSGNTWLRCLLDAYRRNGLIDLNDIRVGISDSGATIMQGVSPMPITALDWQAQMLLRPAALLHLFCRMNPPVMIKTHSANLQPGYGLPHCIPAQFTDKAIYVVRDPRSVLLSFMRFYNFPLAKAVEAMNSLEFVIGGNANFASIYVSTWSNHVKSWAGETQFPVHVVRYEDMLVDAGKELTEVLEFLGQTPDPERVKRAVEATDLAKLTKSEQGGGFRENPTDTQFFGAGGTRWEAELGPSWVKRIERDHGFVMQQLGYLDEADEKSGEGQRQGKAKDSGGVSRAASDSSDEPDSNKVRFSVVGGDCESAVARPED